MSVGSEKDGGHRARVQSIAVSGNNVHVFAVKYVFSFFFESSLPTLHDVTTEKETRTTSSIDSYGNGKIWRGSDVEWRRRMNQNRNGCV